MCEILTTWKVWNVGGIPLFRSVGRSRHRHKLCWVYPVLWLLSLGCPGPGTSSWRCSGLAVPEEKEQCPQQGAVTPESQTDGHWGALPLEWSSPWGWMGWTIPCSFFLGHLAPSDKAVAHLCCILLLIAVQKQPQRAHYCRKASLVPSRLGKSCVSLACSRKTWPIFTCLWR